MELTRHGAQVGAMDRFCYTPLLQQARDTETVKKLIQLGEEHCTPLHFAAYGHLETVKALIKCGVDVEAQTNLKLTPLHIAAWTRRSSEGINSTRCKYRCKRHK
jgi:ankyrin repeat protein